MIRDLIKKIPILSRLARWVWHLLHVHELIAVQQEAGRQIAQAHQDVLRLQAECQALRQDLSAMKQDLTALRQENAELRGLGIVVPRIEAQDEAIAGVRESLVAHRDSAHQLYERLRREVVALSRKIEPAPDASCKGP